MKKLDLSIGILAWKNIKTLEKTLDTFLDNGLFDIVEDITIFFQEISIVPFVTIEGTFVQF